MVSGIIMASGFSRRMGQCKLLMNYGNRPIIDIIMEALEKSSLSPKLVVTGKEEIMELALKRNLQVIINERGSLGQSESIKLGVLNSLEVHGYAFIVGDQPFINARFLNSLVEEFEKQGDKIIVPVYQGLKGNPVIFPVKYRDDFLSLQGDVGGRVILNKYKGEIKYLEINEERFLKDIDTKEDYLVLIDERS